MDRSVKKRNKAEKRTTPSDGSVSYNSNHQFVNSFRAMAAMRHSKDLCDVVFKVGNEHIYAHRVVLSSLSPYFKAMFTGDMAESKQREITINGIDAQSMESLIEYAYSANIEITEDNVQLLLPAASILQFEEIRQVCSNFMHQHLTADNCLGVRAFAEIHGCSKLESAAAMFSQSHFAEVSKKEEFLLLSVNHLKDLLVKDQLNVDSEFEIFEAVIKWIEQNEEDRKEHISELLLQVRLPLLTVQQLLQEVGKCRLVLGDPHCVEMLLQAVEYHLLPNSCKAHKKVTPRSTPKRLYAVGGWDGATAIEVVECFDTETGLWENGPCTLVARNGVSLAVLNDRLYAVGGHNGQKFQQSVEVLDPRLNSWQYSAPMKYRRASLGVTVHKGFLYAIGGQDNSVRLKSVERYDPESNTWQCMANMNMRRDSPGVVSHGDFIYAIGGCHSCMFLDTVERFDPKANQWISVKSMANRRSAVGAVSFGNYIYVFGGHDEQTNLCTLERYNPRTDEWTMLTPMNSPRAGVGGAILDGKIIAIGGFDGVEQLNTVEEYNVEADTWRYISPMRYERSYVGTITMTKII